MQRIFGENVVQLPGGAPPFWHRVSPLWCNHSVNEYVSLTHTYIKISTKFCRYQIPPEFLTSVFPNYPRNRHEIPRNSEKRSFMVSNVRNSEFPCIGVSKGANISRGIPRNSVVSRNYEFLCLGEGNAEKKGQRSVTLSIIHRSIFLPEIIPPFLIPLLLSHLTFSLPVSQYYITFIIPTSIISLYIIPLSIYPSLNLSLSLHYFSLFIIPLYLSFLYYLSTLLSLLLLSLSPLSLLCNTFSIIVRSIIYV